MSEPSANSIAIVGAGVSGLAAAWALRDSDWRVTVFEKSRGVSGRTASRTREGCRIDHGANYFKLDSPDLERLVLHELPTEGLVEVAGDIGVFDRDGKVSPGDPLQNVEPKWNYRGGISTLGKHLAAAAGVQIRRETRVAAVNDCGGGRWELEDDKGEPLGEFDAVLLTPPAPQLADLLRESDFDTDTREGLADLLDEGAFHRQFSLVFGFDGEALFPNGCYALINIDRGHDIAWIAREAAKPGHVPPGESVLIAQMAPAWTDEHYEACDDVLFARGLEAVGSLIDLTGVTPTWRDKQRWRYAHPKVALDIEEVEDAAPDGLFFAGDAFVGKGRVGATIETGLRAAERVLEGDR